MPNYPSSLWTFPFTSPEDFASSFEEAAVGGVFDRAGVAAGTVLLHAHESASEQHRTIIRDGLALVLSRGTDEVRSQALLFARQTSGPDVDALIKMLVLNPPVWLDHDDPRFGTSPVRFGRILTDIACQDLLRKHPELRPSIHALAVRFEAESIYVLRMTALEPLGKGIEALEAFAASGGDCTEIAMGLGIRYGLTFTQGLDRVARVLVKQSSNAREQFLQGIAMRPEGVATAKRLREDYFST